MIVQKNSLGVEAFTRTSKTHFSRIGRMIFILIFVFSLLGTNPASVVQAESSARTANNDYAAVASNTTNAATAITFTAAELLENQPAVPLRSM